jgi:uncharacterized RDD family membrane protein YckC
VPASDKLTIETPEQISLEFALAGAGSRFLALAIDTLIQIGGFAVLGLLAMLASVLQVDWQSLSWALAVLVVLAFTLYYGYYAAFEALWNGQTPGKRAIRLRVITTSGRPITVYEALLRNLLRIVDQLPGIYTVGLLAIFLTERHQRLGDLAADTVVVHEQPIERQDLPARRPTAVHRGASRLRAEEIAVIETFLARRAELPDDLRVSTAHKLAGRMRARLELARETASDDEGLLEEIVAEFRTR